MSRDAAILEALTKTPAGLTVVELSLILNRTGGDITKGVSSLKKAHNIVPSIVCKSLAVVRPSSTFSILLCKSQRGDGKSPQFSS